MGRKAKLKKLRQQALAENQTQQYDSTQFVKQFAKMGYRVQMDMRLQTPDNRGNISPEIPQDRIEPQL